MNFTVTFYFETSDTPETDLTLFAKVSAKGWRQALILAKRILKFQNPNVSFSRLWFWSVEGRPKSM
jgi:hypothetical protein